MITQGQLATELGMSRRTLMRWLARLEIRPAQYKATLAYYPPGVSETIRDAHTKALSARTDLVRAAIGRRNRLITTAEIKRRAKGGTR